ncbi:hypothetical protein BJA01nite_82920 [Bradyrhizobium japonicum]|jgi:hypothetical protein|nr:hypothetical protein BJ6T_32300 [Bradyrhizobium japonicum USDA 6]GEC50650.1 hypothetical protein BJA01nite_82920 [Bradyrhizobium japonicum]
MPSPSAVPKEISIRDKLVATKAPTTMGVHCKPQGLVKLDAVAVSDAIPEIGSMAMASTGDRVETK